MRIFLVGFMGSGKTTVGRSLAEKLGYEFVDLDDVITRLAGRTIAQIFQESGEAAFRQIESDAIRLMIRRDNIVVSLGGGAFVGEENRRLIEEYGISIWLDCPIERILARLEGTADRPLYQSPEQMRELLRARLPAYQQADLRIAADQASPEELAEEIIHRLRARLTQ